MTSSDVPEQADDPGSLESLLQWYVAMGVDAAIDADPHDRFAAVEAAASAIVARRSDQRDAPPPAVAIAPRAFDGQPASADALIRHAEAVAAGATTLEALRQAWEGFEGCALSATASRMIFAGGRAGAALMVIGAAPGSDDERQGEAFAGTQGRLLDGMLRAIGLSREAAYLTNVIPWRPPGNRPPTPLEASLCLPFTRRHIALAEPAFILCLGERAAQLLLDTRETLAKLRGRWHSFEGERKTVKLTVTFSPDYLLSQPLQKRRAWVDLLGLARMMEAKADAEKSRQP